MVLINEFDYVEGGRAAELFRDNYLAVGHNGAAPVDYPYYFTAPVNTGVPSGYDLNNDGVVAGGDDAFGFGLFPGQYGMVVYSKYPIATDDVRTFQQFLWKDMPGALLPDDPATAARADWYSPAELDVFRLSSKSHWDVPIKVPGRKDRALPRLAPDAAHLRRSRGPQRHPQPRRDPLLGRLRRGRAPLGVHLRRRGRARRPRSRRGLRDRRRPERRPLRRRLGRPSDPAAIRNPRIRDPRPTSAGAVEATQRDQGANLTHRGPAAQDTADFADTTPGNLRADYVLPSKRLKVLGSGVYWLTSSDPLFPRLTGTFPFPTSDHRMVWLDLRLR